jgi:hypothetical protein
LKQDSTFSFDKTFLFDRKSIRKEKDTVKAKNKEEGKGTRACSDENRTLRIWTLPILGIRGKRRADLQFQGNSRR